MVALWNNRPTHGSYYSGKVERQKQRLGLYGHLHHFTFGRNNCISLWILPVPQAYISTVTAAKC
jgi:hypothetical protein